MKDLDQKIIELMDLFDDEQVTTADQIKRPERALEKEAIDDFNKRNPMAGGGMLVQPGFGGTRQGYAGDDEKHIYTRKSGAKRLVFGDKVYGSVSKGDKKGLEELKKKRDKLIADGVVKPRVEYDLELLKNQWRKTLPTKKATTWENFLKTKFPKGSTTPNTIRKRTERDFRKGESDFNAKEEFRVNVKEKQNLKKLEQAIKLVEAHKNSDKFLYDKKTIYKKLGFEGVPQVFKKEASTGKVYKSLINEAMVNEVEKLMPIEQKITNAFDKIVNENKKIYEPKGGTKVKKAGILKRMISDIVSPKGGIEKYQVSTRAISDALSTHQPYLDVKNDFDYLEFKLAKQMKGKTFNEALDYAKLVRGGLDMKNIEKFSANYRLPESNVIKFALRSAFNNYKAGNTDAPVRVFNLKADGTPGKEIDFAKLKIDQSTNMKAIDINKIGFTYENQFFTKKDLRTKGLQSGLFDEVYKLTAKGNMPVPDPNNPSKNITLNKLLQLNKDKLTLGHNDAKGGVTKLPFSDLRLEGNKINLALYNAYNKIKNKSLRKLVVNKLQNDFGFLKGDNYERAFIEGERNKATNIANKKINESTLYRQAGRDVITDLGADLLKQKEPFQKEAFRVAGMGKKESTSLIEKLMGDLAGTEDRECVVDMKALVQRKASADGGRIGFKFGTGKPGCDRLAKQIIKKSIKGEGTSQQRSIVNKLIKGGSNILKSAVDPVELLKLRNYVGPQALGFFGLYELGVITDDVLRMGKPLNESLASNWLTKSFLPYTEEFAKQENLLKSGTLTGNQRLFALNAMKYNKLLKEVERIEGMEAAQLTDQGGMGMIDGTPMVPQAEIDKAMANVTRVAETIDPAVLDPRSAKAIENKAKMDEMEATRMAKKKFSPIFGFDKLKNRAENVDTGDYLPDPLKIDLSPITYRNVEDFKPVTELPAERRIALEDMLLPKNQYKPMDRSLSNFQYRDSDKTILEDELEEYNRSQRFKQAFEQPGMLGANEKFAIGGRAGFKEGTPQSVLRKGLLKLIDDSVKLTPKDTTSALDKLIKKTLNEDFFDKKDRIVDTLNVKTARERKNFPYNQQVQEEPSQLNFYDDIVQSDFKTKTGPFFDYQKRKNRAGGGILKQAGDSSGPPPESGPMSEGLQGLIKRGIKT